MLMFCFYLASFSLKYFVRYSFSCWFYFLAYCFGCNFCLTEKKISVLINSILKSFILNLLLYTYLKKKALVLTQNKYFNLPLNGELSFH